MATVERWIDVDAEFDAADHEWTESMFRSLVGHDATSAENLKWSLADQAVGAHLDRDLAEFMRFAETRG